MKRQEGFIPVTGGKIWYEIVGKKQQAPLLIVQGGPGYPHDYLQPLEALANRHEVVFYDQLGCGNSGKPTDKSLWTVDRFLHDLQAVINALNLDRYHLFGQSWGAGLTTAFALTKPQGLLSLILADPYLSTPQWENDAKRLLKQLPEPMQQALEKGDTNAQEYKDAFKEFYYRFVYRFKEFPVPVLKAENKLNSDIYNMMWGPTEFNASGTLKEFDLSKRLHELLIPVLLLCGRFDEATPESTADFRGLLQNAHMEIFEESAHFPMWTEKEKFIQTIDGFLQEAEE